MTDKQRTLAVRVALGLLMTVIGAFMLAGCPVTAQPPLELRAVACATLPG
ncbi:hypothetical protein [Mycobacterium asiaticum]|nr:hypothetical protein [Mycobacterium asiaticum]